MLLVSARLDARLGPRENLKIYQHCRVKVYYGNPVTAKWVRKVTAIYRTEKEARSAVEELAGRNTWDNLAHQRLYDTPVAYPVTFAIWVHDPKESEYCAQPAWGGQLHWNDDRDVTGIFATYEEAKGYADSMNRATGRLP